MKRNFWAKLITGLLVTTHAFSAMVSTNKSCQTIQNLLKEAGKKGHLVTVIINDRVTVKVPYDYWRAHYWKDNNVIDDQPVRIRTIFTMPNNPTYHDILNYPGVLNKDSFKRPDILGINEYNRKGYTPLHELVLRKDATIDHVKDLLGAGADMMMKTKCHRIFDVYGNVIDIPFDAYRNAIDIAGDTPDNEHMGKFFEDQCCGNAEVMRFLLSEMLYRKLEVVAEERKKLEVAAQEQEVKATVVKEQETKVRVVEWTNANGHAARVDFQGKVDILTMLQLSLGLPTYKDVTTNDRPS